MALRNASLFLYGFQITPSNRFITFGNSPSDTRVATLNLGYYSLTGIGNEIMRAMAAADPLNLYTFTVNRNVMGGTQNRVTISTAGTYLRLLFATGNPSNPASLIGFNAADYVGTTTYSGSQTCGTVLIPNQIGYSYLSPSRVRKNFGKVNISASGLKEAIIFSLQFFWTVQFKYIPESVADAQWTPLIDWMIQQREIEFTPDITDPNTVFVGTLEEPSQGLEMTLSEMLPNFPFQYQTPLMKFRVRNEA